MNEWDDDYDDEEITPLWRRPLLWVAAVVVLAAIAAVGYVVANRGTSSDVDTTASSTSVTGSAPVGSSPAVVATAVAVSTIATSTTSVAAATSPPTTVVASTTVAPTVAPSTTVAPTVAPSTDAPTTVASPAEVPTYATLPDGSPAPIIAVFGTENVTLTGAVPTQEAKDKLQALAIANSKFPVPVQNLLTIDPSVPPGIGVRVVELTSARFEPNSAEVQGFHALELDRVVSIMNALPTVTALVIGHADQVGTDAQNFKISAERATGGRQLPRLKGDQPVGGSLLARSATPTC